MGLMSRSAKKWAGKSATAIAEALHLNVKTVSTYRPRILMKTGFKANAEIIACRGIAVVCTCHHPSRDDHALRSS